MPRTNAFSLDDTLDGACGPTNAQLVTARLEEAGATLLALPGTGWTTKLRASSLEIVRAAIENYGWAEQRVRPPVPQAAAITPTATTVEINDPIETVWAALIDVERWPDWTESGRVRWCG